MTDPDTSRSPSIPADATDEEVAAILAALEVGIPRPVGTTPDEVPRWRFSGRWWTKPIPTRRDRP